MEDLTLLRRQDISADALLACEAGAPPVGLRRRSAAFVERMLARYWTPERRAALFGARLLPPELPRDALTVAYAATAAVVTAFGADGTAPRRAPYGEIEERLERFVGTHGLGPLVRVFWLLRLSDHLRALEFYAPMPEDDFVSGRLHLPLFPEFCREDMLWGAATGRLRLRLVGGRACLVLTSFGRRGAEVLGRACREARVAAERERLRSRVAQARADGHGAALGGPPGSPSSEMSLRAYALAAPWPGAIAVEVGADASGGAAEPGGLCERVGPRGQVIAVDPDEHALRRLAERARGRGLRNLRTVVGLGERMPLPSASADVMVCTRALLRLDLGAFVAEVRRVLRPGGVLCLLWPAGGAAGGSAFAEAVRERAGATFAWRVPALDRAAPEPGAVEAILAEAGFAVTGRALPHGRVYFDEPRDLAAYVLEGMSGLRCRLGRLPWAARRERLQQLEAALAALTARFPPAERFAEWRAHALVAVRPLRTAPEVPPDALDLGEGVCVLAHEDLVLHEGRPLAVPPSAARVLRALATADRPVSTGALLAEAGGMSRQTLYNAVNALRRTLPPPLRILLKRRVGYMLIGTAIRRSVTNSVS